MGYGVVKPHLGDDMRKVVIFGGVYFLMAIVYWEAFYMQHAHALTLSVEENYRLQLVEYIFALPLSLLNSICVIWILYCIQTTKAQLLTRNQMTKYAMYNQFFYVLIIAATACMAAMVIQIIIARPSVRMDNWRNHWFDSMIWKLIFFCVLLCILFLWRPNANNKRFAYTKTASVDDQSYSLVSPTYNDEMSLRLLRRGGDSGSDAEDLFVNNAEDDLDWVEQNIPAGEEDRMLFDDDEDAEHRRLELNKME
ncbi:hypothetical protein SARC_14190 [Sphaeroforma arctica JP610]|uniref:GOST seven transmembrane domain-containing protein n=1 Tax=Sphaeroforma arctica JP610 TaxID=667725 RepID=A0A0L0FAX4_9EUKA|nr:hypothetical protein SARC_14190 [Sphaeroforma arctica JP610]KNC73248.1 hypothetical protein SARC_14190 [Sphaeroforma arctica JP610]|eukprot:XP_014147150.1 hypothetical protein SARC_14190 [Sphaeroforma arctica JP610]